MDEEREGVGETERERGWMKRGREEEERWRGREEG
jgi:hypothetical protein